ncbi:hypothetical protein Q73_07940 [Bacillus coahuilensis m2-6]|uniref:YppF-like protein n=1 Tax=Bacillus coahuilensis p1.1.43 TaxID=1150625 RepID=A0A147K8S7_9BACI|nr:YppF family protein [Bacillus coahuilensis]KUP06537.1 hypothetical protein Q75_08415 [Bacillus coahuilensis p1.1.43]KUP08022.1 hypothetical protein Q73_07940 [Bacillus coahuilensis m2-6]
MNVHSLKQTYLQYKEHHPLEMNDLLDFAKNHYLSGEITLKDYQALLKELENSGASLPNELHLSTYRMKKLQSK